VNQQDRERRSTHAQELPDISVAEVAEHMAGFVPVTSKGLHHPLFPEPQPPLESCGSCNADIGPSLWFPWHWEDEDCRAVRLPGEIDPDRMEST